MSGGGEAVAPAIGLPEGQITSDTFDINRLPPNNHIFFDDDVKFIVEASKLATDGIPITTVLCPDTGPIIYKKDNTLVTLNPQDSSAYIREKSAGITSDADGRFKGYISKKLDSVAAAPKAINMFGAGLTTDMIQNIIAFERKQSERSFKKIYFFDFDKVLNQTASIAIDQPEVAPHLESYARYIFSNYVGQEPADGRLTLLKEMFSRIGIDRIYIITSNPIASRDTKPPYRDVFCSLLQQLLDAPVDVWDKHLISTYSKNASGYKSKGDAILDIIQKQSTKVAGEGGRARRQKNGTGKPKKQKSKKSLRATKRASRIRGGSRHKRTRHKFRK